jgi:hypothetical protein
MYIELTNIKISYKMITYIYGNVNVTVVQVILKLEIYFI